MKLSDIIEQAIKDMILEEEKFVELQRNELAVKFNCVPSQINYVLETRFNPTHGYYVESQRGGGGYIRIKKISFLEGQYLMHVINSIGDSLSNYEANIFINNLHENEMLTDREVKLFKVAVSDKILKMSKNTRDAIRANILKNMLINLI